MSRIDAFPDVALSRRRDSIASLTTGISEASVREARPPPSRIYRPRVNYLGAPIPLQYIRTSVIMGHYPFPLTRVCHLPHSYSRPPTLSAPALPNATHPPQLGVSQVGNACQLKNQCAVLIALKYRPIFLTPITS